MVLQLRKKLAIVQGKLEAERNACVEAKRNEKKEVLLREELEAFNDTLKRAFKLKVFIQMPWYNMIKPNPHKQAVNAGREIVVDGSNSKNLPWKIMNNLLNSAGVPNYVSQNVQ